MLAANGLMIGDKSISALNSPDIVVPSLVTVLSLVAVLSLVTVLSSVAVLSSVTVLSLADVALSCCICGCR